MSMLCLIMKLISCSLCFPSRKWVPVPHLQREEKPFAFDQAQSQPKTGTWAKLTSYVQQNNPYNPCMLVWRHKISHVIDGGCQKREKWFSVLEHCQQKVEYVWMNQWGQQKLLYFLRTLSQLSKCWDFPSPVRKSSPLNTWVKISQAL